MACRTEWPKERPVPRYTPYFHDGWAPPGLPDHHTSLDVNAAVAANAAAVARGELRERVPSVSMTRIYRAHIWNTCWVVSWPGFRGYM